MERLKPNGSSNSNGIASGSRGSTDDPPPQSMDSDVCEVRTPILSTEKPAKHKSFKASSASSNTVENGDSYKPVQCRLETVSAVISTES